VASSATCLEARLPRRVAETLDRFRIAASITPSIEARRSGQVGLMRTPKIASLSRIGMSAGRYLRGTLVATETAKPGLAMSVQNASRLAWREPSSESSSTAGERVRSTVSPRSWTLLNAVPAARESITVGDEET
jgi:hypothetical protein